MRRCAVWAAGLALMASMLLARPAQAQDAVRGRELFVALECASCHGDHAQGKLGPPLAGTKLRLADVRMQVRSPSSRRMPTFSPEKLPDEDVEAIYVYLRQLPPPTLADKRTWWGTDHINLPTPRTPRAREFEVHFSHRFSETVVDAGVERLFGLDSFAFPSFWFLYGVSDRVAAYGGRSANFATWELGAKAELLREGDIGVPLSIGAQVGATFLDTDGIDNDRRFTVELPIGYRVSDRLAVQTVPIYATDTDELNRPGSPGHSFALGIGASVKLTRTYSLDGEWITNLGGFERPRGGNQWQAGITIHVGRHLFQLLASDSVHTTPDFMATGTVRSGVHSNIRFGFNLVRGFSF